jgi:hypothetical protein
MLEDSYDYDYYYAGAPPGCWWSPFLLFLLSSTGKKLSKQKEDTTHIKATKKAQIDRG